jgi:hypothetical protein
VSARWPHPLRSITEAFRCSATCQRCRGTGHVCEAHPEHVWGGIDYAGCQCGAPGMPCPEGLAAALAPA